MHQGAQSKGIGVPALLDAANPPTVSTVSGEAELSLGRLLPVQRNAVKKLMTAVEDQVKEGQHLDHDEAEAIKDLVKRDGGLLQSLLRMTCADLGTDPEQTTGQLRRATEEVKTATKEQSKTPNNREEDEICTGAMQEI